MLTQDSCIFFNAHSVYADFGGIVFEGDEAQKLAQSVSGRNKGVILQNHGLLTVGKTVDEAAYLFSLMERLCEVQLKVETATREGLEKIVIGEEAAKYTFEMGSDPVFTFLPDLYTVRVQF
jgi:ribulose-5-phosphate 4-epimerase/fuculose-1-phosphate aldolase